MSNVARVLDQQLPPASVRLLRRAADASTEQSVELFLVGGTVRDMLLGYRPADLDLSAVGSTPAFAPSLARQLDGEVVARSQFGTAKLRIGNSVIDLAMARKESYAHPGALPLVSPGSIDEDLERRDFTINAMAICLTLNRWGSLVDSFDGRRDLERRLVRVLHPQSFVDDSTRILRSVRYAQRLGFQLETSTEQLLKRDLAYLDTIKGDRVRHELERIFLENRAVSMLSLAQDLGVLSSVYPTLSLDDTTLANLQDTHIVPATENLLLFVSVLAYSVPTGDLPGLISRLNMDTGWTRVVNDTGSVRDSFQQLKEPNLRPSQLHSLLRQMDTAAIEGCRLATGEPVIAQHLERFLSELRHIKTDLNGDDLIALGVIRGPMVGKLLDEILAARLDGLMTTREEEETFVRCRLAAGPN